MKRFVNHPREVVNDALEGRGLRDLASVLTAHDTDVEPGLALKFTEGYIPFAWP